VVLVKAPCVIPSEVEGSLCVSNVTSEGLCGCAGEKNDPPPRRGGLSHIVSCTTVKIPRLRSGWHPRASCIFSNRRCGGMSWIVFRMALLGPSVFAVTSRFAQGENS